MKGKNQVEAFRSAADNVTKILTQNESVVGMLYTGGIVRGFADQYSDVDIFVFIEKEDTHIRKLVDSLANDIETKLALETDIEVHVLDNYMTLEWSEYLKWDLSNSIIAFDRDGRFSEQLREKLFVGEEEWKIRISSIMTYIHWYCFPVDDAPSMIDLWEDRGDPIASHHAVNYCLDLLIEAIYAVNRSFVPAPKWKTHYLHYLDWRPVYFQDHLRDAMIIKEMTIEDARRRVSIFASDWTEILGKIREEFGLDYEDAGRIYVENVLHLPSD